MIVELVRQLKNGDWICITNEQKCVVITHEELDLHFNPGGDGIVVKQK